MKSTNIRYITTTLPYVNDEPHVGHAQEFVQADILARFWRMHGHDVFFNTGVDEHGQKIAQKADALGEDRQVYVDRFADRFKELKSALDLSYDAFIRTTDKKHITAVQEIWKRWNSRGDIYKKKYIGLYCVGCEVFYKKNELDENKHCLIHKKLVEEIEEENYFFRLSKYQDQLIDYLSDEGRTLPDWQRKWALEFVKDGVEDISISRQTERMNWGISVPGDNSQVIYVWFDALTNYISTLGWPDDDKGNFKKFWVDGETMQIAGKDQVRFQSIIWQAMLMSVGIKTTDLILYHGFINSGGKKMSKSLGNVISPFELVDKYGVDATRYLLTRHVHPVDDSDITWEKLDEWYTSHLVNGIGNAVARVMRLAELYLPIDTEKININLESSEVTAAINKYQANYALDIIFGEITSIDEKITETEPFKMIKTDPKEGTRIILELVGSLYRVGYLLKPFMPTTSGIIIKSINEHKKPDNMFPRL